jgi:uncharacterized membrane protein YeaQ/YmgE (transglycosylase-associated protein family)
MEYLSNLPLSGIFSTLAVGLVVGLLARVLKPGDDDMSLIMTMVLGVLGSVLAKMVGSQLDWAPTNHWLGWGASVLASIVLLYVYALLFRRPRGQ